MGERGSPLRAEIVSALAHNGSKVLTDSVWNQELCIFRPAIGALGPANFFFTQRLAVGFFRVLFFRRAKGNVAVNNNERRTVLRLMKDIQSAG